MPNETGLVCAKDGSGNILAESIQQGIGGLPIGLCWECRKDLPLPPKKGADEETLAAYGRKISAKSARHYLSPLMPAAEWQAGRPKPKDPAPEDLWAGLPAPEVAKLNQPL